MAGIRGVSSVGTGRVVVCGLAVTPALAAADAALVFYGGGADEWAELAGRLFNIAAAARRDARC